MNALKNTSPLTRVLAILVLVAAVGGTWAKQRIQPLRAELERARADENVAARDLRQTRARIRELREEAHAAQRWAGYAAVLEAQSTGRSLREVLATCRQGTGPRLEIERAGFERRPGSAGFGHLGIGLTVRGPYPELVRFLGELDRVFPPVELTRVELTRPQTDDTRSQGVEARLEGVIHEPR